MRRKSPDEVLDNAHAAPRVLSAPLSAANRSSIDQKINAENLASMDASQGPTPKQRLLSTSPPPRPAQHQMKVSASDFDFDTSTHGCTATKSDHAQRAQPAQSASLDAVLLAVLATPACFAIDAKQSFFCRHLTVIFFFSSSTSSMSSSRLDCSPCRNVALNMCLAAETKALQLQLSAG